MKEIKIGDLEHPSPGAFKIGPFGSSLKKDELVSRGVPVAGIENVLPNRFLPAFRKYITDKKFADLADYQIKPGDVLVTTMGTIGRAAVVPDNIGMAIIDSHLFRMRLDESKVDPSYLSFAINGYIGLQRQLERMARGAIMDGLNTTILKECLIPLPPKEEQKRIVAILDKAERLRRTHRYAQQLSDTLLQSVFVKMFGNPITNPYNFPRERLEDLIVPNRPITYGILKPGEHVNGGVPYIRVVDMKDGIIHYRGVRRTTPEIDQAYKRSRLKAGDLLLSIRGHVGRLAIVPAALERANITQDTARLVPYEDIQTHYLMGCLQSGAMQRFMRNLTKGVAVQGINLGDVKELIIPVPPISLQEKYSRVAANLERLRAQQREAARQAEHLFQTLLHRAFQGEL